MFVSAEAPFSVAGAARREVAITQRLVSSLSDFSFYMDSRCSCSAGQRRRFYSNVDNSYSPVQVVNRKMKTTATGEVWIIVPVVLEEG